MNKILPGLIFGLIGCLIGMYFLLQSCTQIKPLKPLEVRLDTQGPYMIIATKSSSTNYKEAIEEALTLHPEAKVFSYENISSSYSIIQKEKPRYILLFIEPSELDVNFAWQWLTMTTKIDDDPLVDVRTGFITGENPEKAKEFIERIKKAVKGETLLPGALIDNLGPDMTIGKKDFLKNRGTFFLPVFEERLSVSTISHGTEGFGEERLNSMNNAGLVHFGGHGYPDRVVDCLNGPYVRKAALSPCVVFNGACYTGVTGKWYEMFTQKGMVKENSVQKDKSFCLGILSNNTTGYLAALHPDHGIPVYQEMEYLATTGAPLGEIIRYTHNGVIVASGGKIPEFETLSNNIPSPDWTEEDVMLKGTASRVLFGDPSLIVMDDFTKPPFNITVNQSDEKTIKITAILENDKLKSTFTDTYYSDLSGDKKLFNDRAFIVCELPENWDKVSKVEVIKVQSRNEELRYSLKGFGFEKEEHKIYIQIDLPSTGYMQSDFRKAGSIVEVKVTR
jgi:hypothetical protein